MKRSLLRNSFAIALGVMLLQPSAYAARKVVVQEASTISLEEIGLLKDRNADSLGYSLWQGSERAFIETLLLLLPAEQKSSIAKDITRRVLLTAAKPPEGKAERDLLELRLLLLLRRGNYDAVQQMTGAIPEHLRDPLMQRLYNAALFGDGKEKHACDHAVKQVEAEPTEAYWRQMLVFCQAYEGKAEQAELSLKLLTEDKITAPEILRSVVTLLQDATQKELAVKNWRSYITDALQELPKPGTSLPGTHALGKDLAFDGKVTLWWAGKSGARTAERITALTRLYAYLNTLGSDTGDKDWQKLALATAEALRYPEEGAVRPSTLSLREVMYRAAEAGRKGEALLVVLHLWGGREDKDLSDEEALAITGVLSRLGLTQEAKDLALVGLQ